MLVDREQAIKELQVAKIKKAALFKKFAQGTAGISEQHSANLINAWVHALQETISITKTEKKSARDFFAKATTDWNNGNISDSVYSTIKILYEKYPFVLEGLSLSVKKGKENKINSIKAAYPGRLFYFQNKKNTPSFYVTKPL